MDWYYAEAGNKVGPLSEEELASRVARGIVTRTTLVWHDGAEDWALLQDVKPGMTREEVRRPVTPGAPAARDCHNCGKSFPADEVIHIHNQWICASCKPSYFQRIKEGVDAVGDYRFGGFWVRSAAKSIDGLVLGALSLALMIPMFLMNASGADPESLMALNAGLTLIQYPIAIAYTVFFLGRYAATPGKMALGLKVIRPEGEKLTYLRALGRYGGELVSALTFGIGYIMAAFDDEKRALHDRICDTRVIRTR
jgi:uncharacterized RDD family membrane protein YckC